MPTNHIVQQGECVTQIACAYGLLPATLWRDGNNDRLRQARHHPNVLKPGDTLVIPDKRARVEDCATQSRHRFRRKGVPSKLRIRLLNEEEPRSSQSYTLEVDGVVREGVTDKDGWLEEPIDPAAHSGKLTLAPEEVYFLNLGHLDPPDSMSGLQQRLAHLGFYLGEVDDEFGPETVDAILSFQESVGLEATGRPDPTTQAALRDSHGS